MATAVDKRELFGELLPSVYIRSIILETGSTVEDKDPHITTLHKEFEKNEETGKIKSRFKEFNIAKKNISSNSMKVTLELNLKEKLDQGFVPTWFSSKEFLDYFTVDVYQSTEANVTNIISKNYVLLKTNRLNNNVKRKTIAVKEEIKNKSLNEYDYILDSDGSRIYEIPLKISFNLIDQHQEHLAYFVIPSFDIQKMVDQFNINISESILDTMVGDASSELVIDNSEIVSTTFVFATQDQTIWTGPVHQLENGRWRTSNREDPESEYLNVISVPNSKVKDFRELEILKKVEVNFEELKNDILDTKIRTNANLDTIRKKNYFSPFQSTIDSKGNLRFFFSIDYQNLIKDQSVFGNLYKNSDDRLLSNTRIVSLKVSRIRASNNLNDFKMTNGLIPFHINEIKEPIVAGSEKDYKNFQIVNDDKSSLRELVVILDNNQKGIRHFTGIDKTFNKLTFGFYQYEVELHVEDNTFSFIEEQLINLSQAQNLLKSYNSEVLQFVSSINTLGNFSKIFMRAQIAKYKEDPLLAPWNVAISLYLTALQNVASESVDVERFSRCMFYMLHPALGSQDGVLKVIALINDLSEKLNRIVKKSFIGSIGIMGNSSAKSDTTRTKSSNLLRIIKINKYFSTLQDSDIPKNIGYDFLSTKGFIEDENNNDGLKVVSLEEFEERTTKETTKYFQADQNNISLKTKQKIYSEEDTVNNNKYSYLTPSVVSRGGSSPENKKEEALTDKGVNNVAESTHQKIAISMMNFNINKSSPYTPSPSFKVNSNLNVSVDDQEINHGLNQLALATSGLSIETKGITTSPNPIGQTSLLKPAGTVKAVDYIVADNGSEINFSKESKVVEKYDNVNIANINKTKNALMLALTEPLSKNGSIKKQNLQAESIEAFNLNSKNNVLDKKNIKITNLPNQIKSLFVSSINPEKVIQDWHNKEIDVRKNYSQSFVFKNLYQLISKVEVLVGFNTIHEPIWKILSVDLINKANLHNLFCRLKPYINKELGIVFPKGLSAPIYNQYFIISPTKEIIEKSVIDNSEVKNIINKTLLQQNGSISGRTDTADGSKTITATKNTVFKPVTNLTINEPLQAVTGFTIDTSFKPVNNLTVVDDFEEVQVDTPEEDQPTSIAQTTINTIFGKN